MNLRSILTVSRPRFWLYEAATFGLIGTVSTGSLSFFHTPLYWVFLFYFLLPANILIYGINDIFDYETDKHNEKKVEYEQLISPAQRPAVWTWIIASTIPFLFFIPHTTAFLTSFAAFLFFATFYSAPPIRAKAKPFIDSFFSAGHYIATGVFGYYLAGGVSFPLIGIIAGMAWAIAMHAFSAVPDIDADKKAGLNTIAVLLGKKYTIILCWALYITAAYLISSIAIIPALVGALAYSYLMSRALSSNEKKLFTLYTYFPLINTAIGALLSLSLFAKILY